MVAFPLTFMRLRFECQAETPLRLGGWRAGNNLRGALVDVMRRATCPYSVPALAGMSVPPDPEHVATCPVCWLVAANEKPGMERRGYVLTPPLEIPELLKPGERFVFHLTLLGEAQRFLPYFVLAVPEMGRDGVGVGRGHFTLRRITADLLNGKEEEVLREGETILRPPKVSLSHTEIQNYAERMMQGWQATDIMEMRITFHTPLRLIWNQRLIKTPDFAIFFARLLERVDDLAKQFSGANQRPYEERTYLRDLSLQVRLIENDTRWIEVSSGSSRTGRPTWISGLVGFARYAAPTKIWRELLPWLIWGEIVQVGKDTVKGNGVFRLSLPGVKKGGGGGYYSTSHR
ncbi:hypothetical protein SE15_11085 [Thermanaerothrix daxensis]|uniref:CRISPR-associated protein Cas6 C-terminal domain-containing protein n=1 Tax=Thermanaerothrix daxensis TaxID=869279 RepID=A0A0P6XHF4_9CHLR|nr:CRISPR system precrRNA processing endoribonuclease RAMP protein Cas6 [Thermanaerothrix daxensis]KPL82638.1 hypothetical protein SE15_11085 [Thermanaerothrix daxensis]